MGCVQTSEQSTVQTYPIKSVSSQAQLLQSISTLLASSDDSSSMLPRDFWPFFLDSFKKHKMNKDEFLEFFDNLQKFLQFNFQTEQPNLEKQLSIEDFAQKFHKLENYLHFKRERASKYLKFIFDGKESSNPNLKGELLFTGLKFDLSLDEVEKVASKVRTFFQEDMGAFAFLSLYLQKSVIKNLESMTWKQVETEYIKVLEWLEKKYPANQSEIKTSQNHQASKNEEKWRLMKDADKFEFVLFEKGKSSYQILENFIIERSKEAKEKKEIFDKLVKGICYEKGYGFKSGVKIKSADSKSSIFRTIEKLVEDEIKAKRKNKGKQPEEEKDGNASIAQIKEKIMNEKESALKSIKTLLESKTQILFQAKDLLRGKCTFERVEDIRDAKSKIEKKIEESNGKYQIIEVKDKLFGKTKDLVLIIKIEKVIAELQLVLKLDSASNEFNHKIYELKRSEVYSTIPNLFVNNEKWCREFFSDQLELMKFIVDSSRDSKSSETKDFKKDQKMDFKSSIKDIEAFESMLMADDLLENDQSEKIDQENFWIEKNQTMQKFLKVEKEANQKTTKQSQKINEAKFLFEQNNYQSAEEILAAVNTKSQKQASEKEYQQGRVNEGKGKNKVALEHYNKCLEIETKIFGADSTQAIKTAEAIKFVQSKF